MFEVNLPYSQKEFVIPVITFKDIFDLARLLYDNNTKGVLSHLDRVFNIEDLNIIDKFFVIIKARQYYISDSLSLNIGDRSIAVNIANFVNNIQNTEFTSKIIQLDELKQIELGLPNKFLLDNNISNIYDNIIKRVTIGSHSFDLKNTEDIQSLLEVLPPNTIKHLENFIVDKNHEVEIFNSKHDKPIAINFITSQPYDFIITLLSDYDLISCREILFFLSKRMNSETVLKSPISDLIFYIDEYQNEIKQNNGSSNMGLPI